ncbi:IclR family transcriptional regulator C-terminal domain-containing protein [Paraburkholderia sp. BL9I2N2]|uniref:IclR family transcriptional regulator n=1 Tax=Paraburkholderia sp. BL9I2N2 TaxID=1938809 RepID=UPI0010533B3C|nr:IclR family transcriptional regulator C-terminal domain-containing protein [Paraburkholderia sp. BL9I2N2]TCK84133.1 IclR family transcriptional regulator [Paraburkholderia sp. BL9I2N2]
MTGQILAEAELDERLYVASVAKAMRVMECFEQSNRQLSMTDIAASSGLGRSATQRFVYTLYSLGYLRRDPASKLYSLSAKVFRFVHGMIGANAALERSYHVLSQLAKETRETVSWVELDNDEIVVIGNVPSVHLASITLSVGSRFVALPSSSGQVLLCQRPAAELTRMVERLDSLSRLRFGEKSSEDVLAYLDDVREAGVAITEKSFDEGSISISAPVYDYAGRAIAAINLSTLTSRYSLDAARTELAPQVIAAAQAASGA